MLIPVAAKSNIFYIALFSNDKLFFRF